MTATTVSNSSASSNPDYDVKVTESAEGKIQHVNVDSIPSVTIDSLPDVTVTGLVTFNTTAAHAYSVLENECLMSPVSLANVPTNMYTFTPDELSLKGYAPCPQIPSTVTDGDRLALDHYIDGTDKKTFFYWLPSTQSYMLRNLFYV